MKPEHISQYLYELRESATYTEVHEWGPHDADMLRRVTVLLESAQDMLDTLRAIYHLLTGDEFEEYPSRDLENDIRQWAQDAIRKATEG